MNGDFEQFCLSKYTQGKTTHYIMESNNNKDMYKFIQFIKPHMLKYTENM